MIEFNPIGTITVTIDDTEYVLRRPKFRQWRYFKDQIGKLTEQKREELSALTMALAEASQRAEDAKGKAKAEAQEEADRARRELETFANTPFYETSSELIREMFAQLSDKALPEDKDDWPVFLVADVTLPGQILNHWQTAPKASGAATQE